MPIYADEAAYLRACHRSYVRHDILDEVDHAFMSLCASPSAETYKLLKDAYKNVCVEEDGDEGPVLSPMFDHAFGYGWIEQMRATLVKFKKGKRCPLLN